MFEKYDAYKDSGIDGLEALPLDWKVLRFRDICDFGKGLNITKENLEDIGIPCVNYGEVHSKYGFEVNPENNYLKCVSENYLKISPQSLLNYGDFVFADTSEDIQGSGNFTYLNSHQMTFAGYHTVIVRPKKGLNVRFLAYVFDSISFRNQIRKVVKGVKVYSITKAILKNTDVWLPDLDKQNGIAKFLDQKTSEIDQAIAIKEQQIVLLNEHKQIFIQKAVTQGLDPNVPMKDSGVEWIGQMPEHWQLKKIKHVTGDFMYGTSVECNTLSSGTPVLRIPNIDELHVNFNDLKFTQLSKIETENYSLKQNDILVIRTNGNPELVGKSALIRSLDREFLFASYLIRIKPKKLINPEFLICIMNSSLVRKALTNGARTSVGNYNLNTQTLGNCFLTFPPLEEQLQILNFIRSQSLKLDEVTQNYIQEIEKLKEYKTTLINDAVTGKIKVV